MTDPHFLYIPAAGLCLHYGWLWLSRWCGRRFLVRTWGPHFPQLSLNNSQSSIFKPLGSNANQLIKR